MDNRQFTFFTALKLLLFTAAAVGVKYACSVYLTAPLDRLMPSVIMALVTLGMIYFIEHNKPSFICEGNMGESLVVGFTSAVLVYVVPVYILWATDSIKYYSATDDGDIVSCLSYAVDEGLFPGIVIFGYIFHMLWCYVNDRTAVVMCSIMYFAYVIIYRYNVIQSLLNNELVSSNSITLVNIAILAVSVSVMVLAFGDVLSAAPYLFWLCFFEYTAARFLHIGMFGQAMQTGIEMYSLPTVMLMLILRILTFIIYILAKKRSTNTSSNS
ncbi:MAG: hypothetical protein ILP19_03030 [Oscillospiraceae bacterium]|nr:hypothetical protein [Oscillospiraceae bacterium]